MRPVFGTEHRRTHSVLPAVAAAWFLLAPVYLTFGQADDESDVPGGTYLDNTIVGRDYALRLSAEVQFTDEDNALLSDDPAYLQFPTRMYAAEARLSCKNGLMFAGMHDTWSNQQGLDVGRWVLTGRYPLDDAWRLAWMMRVSEGDNASDANKDYHYLALSKAFKNSLYMYSQYRYGSEGGSNDTHQASLYMTYNPFTSVRLGGQITVTGDFSAERQSSYQLGKVFVTFYAWQDRTSIRLLTQYYRGESGFRYNEYESSLYQRLDSKTFIRLDLRYYDDTSDLASFAWGVKLKRHFTPRFSADIGYRSYDHNTGPDFDSIYGGAEVLF